MKKEIILDVSRNLDISPNVIEKVYKAYWSFIKETIQALPLKDNLSEEEFSTLKTNFNVPSLGKLCVTWNRFVGCKKRYELIKKLRSNVQ